MPRAAPAQTVLPGTSWHCLGARVPGKGVGPSGDLWEMLPGRWACFRTRGAAMQARDRGGRPPFPARRAANCKSRFISSGCARSLLSYFIISELEKHSENIRPETWPLLGHYLPFTELPSSPRSPGIFHLWVGGGVGRGTEPRLAGFGLTIRQVSSFKWAVLGLFQKGVFLQKNPALSICLYSHTKVTKANTGRVFPVWGAREQTCSLCDSRRPHRGGTSGARDPRPGSPSEAAENGKWGTGAETTASEQVRSLPTVGGTCLHSPLFPFLWPDAPPSEPGETHGPPGQTSSSR